MNFLSKILSVAALALFTFTSTQINANEIANIAMCKEFNQTKTIYLITNETTEKQYITSNNQKFTFTQTVTETWSDKKIIPITEKEFEKVSQADQKFCISIGAFIISSTEDVVMTSMTGILIRKGKTNPTRSNILAWMNIDLAQYEEGYFTERFLYSIKSLHYMTSHCEDKSYRGNYCYQLEGFEDYLSKSTLYIREDLLSENFKSEEAIQKQYRYKFKIVTKQEWEKAIKEATPNLLIVDEYLPYRGYGLFRTNYNIINASTGQFIITAFPFLNSNKPYKISKSFFKIFKKQ